MAIQKKHGKGRLDKWYKLAKEKGYRARAAFKLIQLNRKYGFLEKSKVLLDLCAAPGSWCQVAAESMPQNSVIVGVDLAPIKTIPRVITFQSDITTPQCRATIRQHLKTWKADTVLHDGAPNVGTAWVQDAFSQAELVLQSLKLATEFLIAGGTFVTKVFRSKDYNALLWVFNQLFTKVEATKPPSSRNVSAEIFVVCRGYKAPKRIDPRFLDPSAVFAELADPAPNNEAKVFNPEQKKRKREGYEEGNYTQYKEVLASEFIEASDPLAILGQVNRLTFKQSGNGDVALAALDRLPETTTEIRTLCQDLRVLGRRDFRLLLKWRLKAREIFGFSTKNRDKKEEEETEEVAKITPMDEELQIQEELQLAKDRASAQAKRERRRENERKQREIRRLQLNMTVPAEIGMEQVGPRGEGAMFKLNAVNQADWIDKVVRGRMAVIKPIVSESDVSDGYNSDSAEDQLEQQLDDMYHEYQSQRMDRDAKYRAKKARKEDADGEWEGISDGGKDESDQVEEESDSQYGSENNLAQKSQALPLRSAGSSLSKQAALFYDQDIFKEIGVLDEGEDSAIDLEADNEADAVHSKGELRQPATKTSSRESSTETVVGDGLDEAFTEIADDDEVEEEEKAGEMGEQEEEDEEMEEADKEADRDPGGGFEVIGTGLSDWDKQGEVGQDGRLNIDIITAEAMTLAQQVASGQKTAQELVDDSFHRYSFRDKDGLPEWFLEDETKHSQLQRPITAAGAAAIKEKFRALNARMPKKVQEAKARKKMRAVKRLENLKRKSGLLAEDEGLSEKDKASGILKLMSKAGKKKPKQKVQVVVAGGSNKGAGRPKGVKGKYKMVDSRGKKDRRAEKRLAKKK